MTVIENNMKKKITKKKAIQIKKKKLALVHSSNTIKKKLSIGN